MYTNPGSRFVPQSVHFGSAGDKRRTAQEQKYTVHFGSRRVNWFDLLKGISYKYIMNEKKQALIKKLHDVNMKVHWGAFEGEAVGDICGFDDMHLAKALHYVPNHVLKKWIRHCVKCIKEHEQEKQQG